MAFDPNAAAGSDSGIFGLPYSVEQAAVVYLPVPWEVTTSYGGGTSRGPEAILAASRQVDLFDAEVEKPYEPGLAMLPIPKKVVAWNREGRREANKVIAVGGEVGRDKKLAAALARANALGDSLNDWVRAETDKLLAAGKLVGVIGGDHSVPFGAFQALAARHGKFGILHFDAHSDTRAAYEGFTWSHASIFHNVLERIPEVTKLVQVGIRDFCEAERDYVQGQGKRVAMHTDRSLNRRRFSGEPWGRIAAALAAELPKEVWISFDIDGLDPRFCPHTGTPVPGGLSYDEALYLIGEVARSGRRILGFDLNEVAPGPDGDEWDANVGARLLYKLTAWALASQGKAKPMP